ncbi:MAG: YceH family protein [Steroidobacteraceae bacterium]
MEVVLTPLEIRVLGCLVEKEATTPENYPLSLNALTNACNQKTNRDPVMNLTEHTVQATIDSLVKKTLVGARSGAGGRVAKYAHRLHDRLNPDYDFARDELAPMCELMLRGPQTLNELRTRCARIHEYADTEELAAVLARLEKRPERPYVKRLARQPGQKEARYAQLLTAEQLPEAAEAAEDGDTGVTSDDMARLGELEVEVRSLRRELQALSERVAELLAAR